MNSLRPFFLIACLGSVLHPVSATAQDHSHGHTAESKPTVTAPTVFLDKSPRIVEYQLRRLENERLLLVERQTDDPMYAPVYSAILRRVGMSPQYRQEAVEALKKLNDKDSTSVLLDAIETFDPDDPNERRVARELSAMLLRAMPDQLAEQSGRLSEATASENPLVRQVGFAALVAAGQAAKALELAAADERSRTSLLDSVSLIPDDRRAVLREKIVQWVSRGESEEVTRAAIRALGWLDEKPSETFRLVAPLVDVSSLRTAAVRTLLKIPASAYDAESSGRLVKRLVEYAEQTPAEDRTSDQFIDAMQLADKLMARIPTEDARRYRQRLSEVTVRLIRIRTVEEEMRYDTAYFAVAAGSQVQIVLENEDLMQHNLVITVPGALKEVANLGLQVGPDGGESGLAYVPDTEKVLHATPPVAVHGQERLTFTAPEQPGEYPYVCTFPQHWYRMYGVMVVVEDLDAWLKKPTEPANPIGSNRRFVQNWKLDDFAGELDAGMRGRSPEIGKKLFAEASCAGCHKVQGEGGEIGPDLTDVFTRWKGVRLDVLREILEPSHKVDPKYAMQRVLTFDGRTYTGILLSEDKDQVTLVASPDAKQPTVIAQDDIDAMVPSSVSMMPKALLDQYTKDEIFEILAYLESVESKGE